ncbi:hypothetical protein NG99_19045 [Erwinia typographi]|uniref:Uncharacterized protein n=1 Tax=Erwinia typographi TaxID=371042 RepID=A0A0A3YRK4_9GAMM|nr:hypothetical protein NG99_19045 [Erwinia typographi]
MLATAFCLWCLTIVKVHLLLGITNTGWRLAFFHAGLRRSNAAVLQRIMQNNCDYIQSFLLVKSSGTGKIRILSARIITR